MMMSLTESFRAAYGAVLTILVAAAIASTILGYMLRVRVKAALCSALIDKRVAQRRI
jgi:hypothetical protein